MESFYRRILWATAALLLCGLAAWIVILRGRRSGPVREEDDDPGLPSPGKRERLVLSEDIRLGQTGSVSYRGSVWSARNEAGRDLKVGEVVFVERVEPTHTIVVTAAGGVVERH